MTSRKLATKLLTVTILFCLIVSSANAGELVKTNETSSEIVEDITKDIEAEQNFEIDTIWEKFEAEYARECNITDNEQDSKETALNEMKNADAEITDKKIQPPVDNKDNADNKVNNIDARTESKPAKRSAKYIVHFGADTEAQDIERFVKMARRSGIDSAAVAIRKNNKGITWWYANATASTLSEAKTISAKLKALKLNNFIACRKER